MPVKRLFSRVSTMGNLNNFTTSGLDPVSNWNAVASRRLVVRELRANLPLFVAALDGDRAHCAGPHQLD
jgi:hypothetical protein